jgi:hypothetical protein
LKSSDETKEVRSQHRRLTRLLTTEFRLLITECSSEGDIMNAICCPIRLTAGGVLLSILGWLLFPTYVRADAGSAAGAAAEYENAQRVARNSMGQLVTVRQMAMKVGTARPEYVAAADLVKQTHEAYLASQKGTLADLSQSNAKYKDLLKQREAAEAELDKLRRGGASPESFGEVATRKLNITQQIRELEDSAGKQAGSPELKKRWQDACKALEVL